MPFPRRSFWAILALAALFLGLGAAFVARHLGSPSDGARLEPGTDAILPEGLVLTPLQPDAGPLEEGDVLLAIDGRPIGSWAAALVGQAAPPAWGIAARATYQVLRDGRQVTVPVLRGPYPLEAVFQRNWGTISFAVVFLTVAGFVFIRQPQNPAGRVLFLGSAALASSTTWSFGLSVNDFIDGTGFWLYKLTSMGAYSLYWITGLHFALLFPKPLPVLERRWLVPALYLVPYLLIGAYLLRVRLMSSGLLDWLSRWSAAEGVHASLFLIAALSVLAVQLRRNQARQERTQIRWVVFAGLLSGGAGFALYILPPVLGLQPIAPNLVGVLVLPFPMAIAVAILRHNLFDIDRLINRTLVYGVLTAGTIALYILIVVLFGESLEAGNRTLVAFLTTGLVAVIFQPLRSLLQRFVNRMMYGERDDPYTVLTRLGTRLEQAFTPGEVLPVILDTVAQTLKLPFAAIHVYGREPNVYGIRPRSGTTIRFPLVFQGEVFGAFEVAPRGPDEPFDNSETRLLSDLTRQIEIAVHSVRLNEDLQRSRAQLVTAREEERRRIRRDLHDGLGPRLASQSLTLEAIEKNLARDPDAALRLIGDLKKQSQEAIADIRQLIYDLRPPALDDLGLVEALNLSFSRLPSGLKIRISQDDALGLLPAAVELAAYRIATEAVLNVVRHAQASTCSVRLTRANGTLIIDVEDDGIGLPERIAAGIGMRGMRARAEELGGQIRFTSAAGGGTCVRAALPLEG